MTLNRYYLIKDATNGQYYTDDHDKELGDRWSSDIADAYKYSLLSDAELELNTDSFSSITFIIEEIVIRVA